MVIRLFLPLLAVLTLLACAKDDPGAGEPVVLAAASLQEALEEAAGAFAAQGNPRPVLSFAGTPAIARQVQQGAPADLIITADAEWMDQLQGAGLLENSSRTNIAGNTLVMVAKPDADGQLPASPPQGPFLAMADPESVPAGRYAKAALQSAGMWNTAEGRTTNSDSVRSALALVERGEVPFGIIYRSDVMASGKVTAVLQFPEGSHPPIRYPAALVASFENAAARGFLAFLTSDAGQAIFLKHGFTSAQ